MDYDKMMAAHSIEVQEENGKLKSKIRELERENYELKEKNEHLTKIITYVMEREDICYIDDGEYGLQIVE